MNNDQPEIQAPESSQPTTLCPLCQSEIAEDANFCAYCGKQIRRGRAGITRWAGYLVLVLLVAGGLGFYYLRQQQVALRKETTGRQRSESVIVQPPERRTTPAAEPPIPFARDAPSISVTVGTVVLNDITGQQMARIPAAALAGGWLALPKRICLGGYDWQFLSEGRPPTPIEEGIAADDDPVGLWRLRTGLEPDAVQLAAWRADRPLNWIPLTGADDPVAVTAVAVEQGSHFARVQLDSDIFEVGFFIQDEKVVGWTFGDLAEDGFLWIGADGSGRVADLRVDDFYRISFAGSREEELLRALTPAGDYTDLERLALLAGAFRYDSRMAPEDLRPELRPAAVFELMQELIENGINAGLAVEVADLFDAEILSRAADPALVIDVIRATAAGSGFGRAVGLLENTVELMPAIEADDLDRLKQVQAELYRRWLTNLIQARDFVTAAETFENGRGRLPDDLDIHLLGVKLALAQNDWTEAERLLAEKTYPPDLSAAVAGLRSQILDLKAQAGTIVIRFAPGSRQIPVVASLDTGVRQQFIVDTGASMVTIPSDTARELGLVISVRNPRRTIYTAGGVVTAPEVVLPSIAIDDWEVKNVKALVVDLPDELGYGLLGMNYLRRFRMDLNTDEGLLLLEPR